MAGGGNQTSFYCPFGCPSAGACIPAQESPNEVASVQDKLLNRLTGIFWWGQGRGNPPPKNEGKMHQQHAGAKDSHSLSELIWVNYEIK